MLYPEDLKRFGGSSLLPQPLTFHKPRQDGKGVALKLNLRFKFEWGHTEGEAGAPGVEYLARTRGGCFVDFAQQGDSNAAGNATFRWADRATLLTAKLGLPDLSGLLVGYREVRLCGAPVPIELRPPVREQDDEPTRKRKATSVSFTHKTTSGTTIIGYQFMESGGVFQLSKSREQRASIRLGAAEELRFFRYLELAQDTVLRLGGR